jgi:hypothetical protein
MTTAKNAKQRKTHQRIFAGLTPNDILWAEILSLLEHLGYTITTRGGSLFTFRKNENLPLTAHRPHPSSQTSKSTVRKLKEFLENNGDTP